MFVRTDGSYIPVESALRGDYQGLVNRDEPSLCGTGHTATVRLGVRGPTIIDNMLVFTGYVVARVPPGRLSGELADVMLPESG